MIAETKPLAELTQEAIRLLYRELGVTDTVRFLRQFSVGFGNYVEERDELFGGKTLDEMVDDIERRRQ
ncbi:MAG: hypothetical protein FJZ90_04035 [Chloroflexi bacterium]|nr:hypothetical protein [Chloroflexota bacterium]